ncbi:DUF3667 domain-containing protein [Sphingomonas crocodyli]|uniref:DUF3667 domain-containing protein n=1 Tax=Sphingomonas crocodyli TaxID=1979270 RepID=A0A437M5E1_9SPHN|nr:DUF3667 domain-containing protein [Sphingomonas crocodyli]RVT92889.1 DUF3667 domain-containing protein [Sphingomonas crocodyli]
MTGEFEAVADMATGALAKRAIDGGDHGHGDHDGACLNCGTDLVGPHCHQCGQSGHIHKTAHALFHDIAHGVFHFEGRTWHTLPMLFTRPGELTRRYIDGERVKFVSPMALFLFSVFLMVATFSLVGGPTGSSNAENRAVANEQARKTDDALGKEEAKLVGLKEKRATLKGDMREAKELDIEIVATEKTLNTIRLAQSTQAVFSGGTMKVNKVELETGFGWIDRAVEHATQNPDLTFYKLQSSAYKYSWALIPISIPFIWLLFAFRRDVGLYDHAIFATYSLSAMTLMVVALSLWSATGIWQALVGWVLVFFPPWHMYRQLKGAYGLSRGGAIWRTAFLIFFAYTSAFLFVLMLLAMGLSH